MATPRVRNTENMKLKMYEVWEMLQKHFEINGFGNPKFYDSENCTRCAVGMLMSKEKARKMQIESNGEAFMCGDGLIRFFRENAKKKYRDLPILFLESLEQWHDAFEHETDDCGKDVETYIENYEHNEESEQYEHLRK